MNIHQLHSWNVTPAEARAIQEELRDRLDLTDAIRPQEIGVVAGVDNAYSRAETGSTAHAVVVVMRFPEMDIIETAFASAAVSFPYVPGMLTFREAPAVIEAFRQISTQPDVVLFDGHGYSHPRRIGLASHMGLLLDIPSIGCAKSKLIGSYEDPGQNFGDWTPLTDHEEVIGAAVRTRPSHSPLFVSSGNRISVPTAVDIVLACCRNDHFMPEPTRLAHRLVTAHKQAVTAGQ